MKLKRHYHPDTLGRQGVTPRVSHVEVIHTGTTPEQNFDDGMIDAALAHGWASLEGAELLLKTDGAPLRYAVKRAPGYFCKSTGEVIPITAKAWARFRFSGDSSLSQPEARAWLAAKGKEPNDYDIAVAYHCVIDPAQHAHFRAVLGPKNQIVAAHAVEA